MVRICAFTVNDMKLCIVLGLEGRVLVLGLGLVAKVLVLVLEPFVLASRLVLLTN